MGTSMSASVSILRTGDKDAVAIGKLYDRARKSMVDSVKDIIEAGRQLTSKKLEVGHGEWLPWLKRNAETLGFRDRTANAMMKGAQDNPQLTADLTETDAAKINKSIWSNKPKTPVEESKPKRIRPPTKTDRTGKYSDAPPSPQRAKVFEAIKANPTATHAEIVATTGLSGSTVSNARKAFAIQNDCDAGMTPSKAILKLCAQPLEFAQTFTHRLNIFTSENTRIAKRDKDQLITSIQSCADAMQQLAQSLR